MVKNSHSQEVLFPSPIGSTYVYIYIYIYIQCFSPREEGEAAVPAAPRTANKQTYIHQAKARDHLLVGLVLGEPAGGHGAGGAAGVDEELVHVLEGVEAVGAAVAEDVDVELVGLGEQQVGLGGHEREALDEADAQRPVRHHLRQRQRRGLHVEPPLHDLQVRRDRPQVLVRVPVRQVAQAQRLPDLARREELLELLCVAGNVNLT